MATLSRSISNIAFKQRAKLFFSIVPAAFLADYFTKYLVQGTMIPYEEIIPVILIASSVAIIIILYIFYSRYEDRTGLVALCLIAGGATGNLFDRIVYGKVVDFIEIGINDLTWPVFNVADISVTCGAVLLALRLFSHKPEAVGHESGETSGQSSPSKRD